ncbi:GNAT family N-acetyltransferase [Brevundimonas goettingensis]|uniref:GNAT family N-acetyltransferase n=1 Tax=Brevundimonas goettingensis TaxID=2774190 RepID=A0A975GVT8_9CAUL|nr:GNAT family N-acetyltransferase [Brevundimonas goettingensis]QTC91028.1 GNAT family N-acetyltransferase [Brevundimonas goettingensis]
MSADSELLALWTRGWALTRGVEPPAWDDGGWRVEVGAEDQMRRYVFAEAGEALARRAETITEAHVFLKVCAGEATARPLLPARWTLRPPGFLMTLDGAMAIGPDRDEGYRVEIGPDVRPGGPVVFCTVRDASGAEAGCGRAVIVDDRVVYDRILVEPAHQRRGLGGRIMRALETATGSLGKGALVATEDGQALYRTLGWRTVSPYTTAVIPD